MLELAQLKFAVDTSELKTAVDLVKTLGDATRELGQDVSKLATADKNAAAASLMAAKARKENAQAAAQEAKNTKAVVAETNKKVKVEKEAAEATSQRVQAENKATEASIKSAKAAKSNTDMLQRQQDVLEFMTQGYTRGQARQLAMYKSTGALTDQLKEMGNVLQSQNKLIGGDPFDKSSSHIRKMQQEVTELTHGLKYLEQGMIGSSEQLRGFTRDSIRLVEAAKSQGRSIFSIRDALREQRQEYQTTIGVHSQLIAQEREQERLSKERAKALVNQAKANDYVNNEMNRAENALQGLNSQLQISSSNRILKFEQALAKSGLSVQQRTVELEKYKAVILATDAARAKSARRASMEQSERQVNLLARSLAPQISDVLVSLQTGMNPFTVMMQQGMQVRDLIQLSGVESEKLGEAFKRAGQGMITTSIAAGKAIGSMIVGVLMDAGKMVSDFGMQVTGLGAHFKTLRNNLIGMTMSGDKLLSFLGQAGLSIGRLSTFAAGLAVALPVAILISFAVALRQIIKEENELNRVTTSLGASMGLNYKSALDLTSAMGEVSGSTSRAITVLQEFIKSGNLSKDNYKDAADSIIQANIVMGTSIEDLVSKYSELAKSPTEGLIQLAKETGKVEHSLISVIRELENSGNANAAAALAVKERARVEKEVAAEVEENLGVLSKMALYIKRDFIDMWNTISGNGRTSGLEGNIKKVEETLEKLKADAANGFGISFISDYEIKKQEKKLDELRAEKRKKDKEDAEKRSKTELELIRSQQAARDLASRSTYDKNSRVLIAERERLLALEVQGIDVTKELNANIAASTKLYEDYIKSLEKKEGKQKKGSSDNFAERSLYAFSKAAIEAENRSEDLTRSQLKLLQIMEDPRWAEIGYAAQSRIKAQAAEAIAYEKTAEAIKKAQEAAKQSAKEAFDNEAALFDEMVKTDEALKNSAKAIAEETQMLEYQASIIGLTSEERAKAIEFRKLEIELAEELRKIEENPYTKLDPSWAAEQRAKAHENFLKKRSNLDAKYDLEYNQKLTDDITDAVMTGLIEGGEAGKKKLRDLLVAELQKPVKMFIQAVVTDIFGLGGGSKTGGFLNNLSNAYSAYSNAQAGSRFAAGGGNTMNAIGQWAGGGMSTANALGSAYANATGGGIDALLATNNAYGTGAGGMSGYGAGYAAAGVVGGVMAGRAISGGYSAAGKSGNAAVNTGTAIGAAVGSIIPVIGTALGALIGGALGGVFNRAFGRKLKEEGLKAILRSGAVAEIQNYKFEKGGWFKSDKTTTSATDQGTVSQVTRDVEKIKMQALGMAKALGLNASAIENFSGELKINLKGVKSAEEASQRYSEGMQKLYVDMLNATGGLDQFRRSGETVEVALQRLTQEASNLAQQAGYSAEQITSTLVAGMTGKMTEEDVGAALGDIIVGSVYNALAMGFAEQITGAITGLIIQPIMTAVMTGGSVASAVHQASIDAVLATAKNAINAFTAILNDPAMQELFTGLNSLVAGVAKTSVKSASSIKKYGSALKSISTAASDAAREAERIADERRGLERRLLELQGNTAELRKLELAELHPSNRALQQRIWLLEDEQIIADERIGLERRILELQGNSVELRKLELVELNPSNRALQQRIWLLEDEQKITDLYKNTLGRAADAEGFAYWVGQISNGLITLADLEKSFEAVRITRDLQERILELTDEEALLAIQRKRELSLLSASDQVLQKRIWALEEEQRLLEENAQKASEAAGGLLDTYEQINSLRGEAFEKEIQELKEKLSMTEQLIEAAKGLKKFVEDLNNSVDSGLSTEQRLINLQRTYLSQLGAARGGDVNAFSDIQGTTRDILEIYSMTARTEQDYRRQVALMSNELNALADKTKQEQETLQQTIRNKIDEVTNQLEELNNSGKKTLEQLQAQLEQDLKNTAELAIKGDNIVEILSGLPSDLASELSSVLASQLAPMFSSIASAITVNTSAKISSDTIDRLTGAASSGKQTISTSKDELIKTAAGQVSAAGLSSQAQLLENVRDLGYSTYEATNLLAVGGVSTDKNVLATAAGIQDIYNNVLGRTADESGIKYWTDELLSGKQTASSIVDAIVAAASENQETINEELLGSYIPKFDVGTNYVPKDTLAIIHKGEAVVPKQYNPAADTGRLSNPQIISVLSEMRDEIVMLRAEVRADVSHNSKTAKLLDRVIPDGANVQVIVTNEVSVV